MKIDITMKAKIIFQYVEVCRSGASTPAENC